MPRVSSAQNTGWARQAAARNALAARESAGAGVSDPGCGSAGSKVQVGPARGRSYEDDLFGMYQEILKDAGQDTPEGISRDRDADAMQRVREHLLSSKAGAAVCLICLESIGPKDPAWNCSSSCFAVLHLQCAQSWAQQQLSATRARVEERRRLYPNPHPEHLSDLPAVCWACPKCRHEYSPEETPRDYLCFCGKVKDPDFDPWKAPHSCGELCGRTLNNGCEHTCVLLCHPGPCPPCPREVDISCFCGKKEARMRCGHLLSCQMTCGKALPCGHTCQEMCHPEECPPCSLEALHPCRCGAEKRRLDCASRDWTCGRPCNSCLSCGRHSCQLGCHSGPCPPCELEGDRGCPCGKATFRGRRCDEPTPVCGETCGKLLSCGAHTCAERCHTGPCPETCRKMVPKSCRCGKTQKEVPCYQEDRCDRRCPLERSCRRHACKRRCCSGDCPPCPETCGRKLKCGNHKCMAPCHAGSCLPCPLTVALSCACGAASFSVPCGSERRVEPPQCSKPCAVPYLCRHKGIREPHPCHYGPCPPCPISCQSTLPCGHSCGSSVCHDRQPPAVAPHAAPPPPRAPGEQHPHPSRPKALLPEAPAVQAALLQLPPRATEAAVTSCSPCQVPVEVSCLGGHGSTLMPCSSAAPFSCGKPCGGPLPCGNHTCGLPCHEGAPGGCEGCERDCQVERPCGHPCPGRCHPAPCEPCVVPVERICHCSKTKLEFPCTEIFSATPEERLSKVCCGKPCHKQLPDCPHACTEPCHPHACGRPGFECRELVTVRCSCKKLKEKWPCSQVKEALRSRNGSPSYSESSSLRLLECGGQCQQQQRPQEGEEDEEVKPQGRSSRDPGGGEQDGGPPGSAAPEAGKAAAAADLPTSKPMTKEEKRKEREARQLARLAAQEEAEARKARSKQIQLIMKVVGVILLLLAGIGLGLVLFQVAAPDEL